MTTKKCKHRVLIHVPQEIARFLPTLFGNSASFMNFVTRGCPMGKTDGVHLFVIPQYV